MSDSIRKVKIKKINGLSIKFTYSKRFYSLLLRSYIFYDCLFDDNDFVSEFYVSESQIDYIWWY